MAFKFKLAELYAVITAKDALSPRLKGMRANLEKAQQTMERMGQSARRVFKVVAAAAIGATWAMYSFEREMARVQALTGATSTEFSKLNREARELGRSTIFTAVQAGQAMGEFALMGFKTTEILKAMKPTLDLAAVGQLNMADASAVTSGIMRGMKLEASDLTHVVDVLSVAVTTSATNLPQLGEAMKMLGPMAASSGKEVEEVIATLQLFGNVMIRGTMAGTALRNILVRLQAQPSDVRKTLEALNVTIGDSDGKMRHLADIVDDLNEAMVNYTDVQRQEAISKIAGLRALSAFTELLSQGGTVLREYEERLKGANGKAQEMADIMLDTLYGSSKLLISALKDLAITVGNSFAPALREMGEIMISIIKPMAAWASNNRSLVVTVTALTLAVTGLLVVLPALALALSAIVAHPIIAGVLALAAVMGVLVGVMKDMDRESRKLSLTATDRVKKMEEELALNHDMATELKALIALKSRTALQDRRMINLSSKLSKAFSGRGLGVQDVGGSLVLDEDAFSNIDKEMRRRAIATVDKDYQEIYNDWQTAQHARDFIINKMADPKKLLGAKLAEFMTGGLYDSDALDPDQYDSKIQELFEKQRGLWNRIMELRNTEDFIPVGANPQKARQRVEEIGAEVIEAYNEMLDEIYLANLGSVEKARVLNEREANERILLLHQRGLGERELVRLRDRIRDDQERKDKQAFDEYYQRFLQEQKAKMNLAIAKGDMEAQLAARRARITGDDAKAELIELERWFLRAKMRADELGVALSDVTATYEQMKQAIIDAGKADMKVEMTGLTELSGAIQRSVSASFKRDPAAVKAAAERKEANKHLKKIEKNTGGTFSSIRVGV